MKAFTWYQPTTVDEVLDLILEKENCQLMAGGTDLLVRWKRGIGEPKNVVSLKQVRELGDIWAGETGLELGAMVQVADLPRNILIQERFPALVAAALRHSSPLIRNLATVVGNICNASPAADLVPALLVYGAQVKLQRRGRERLIPLKAFFAGPGKTVVESGELVTAVLLPAPRAATRSAFAKDGKRKAHEIAVVNCAVGFEAEDALMTNLRVAMGAVGPTPILLEGLDWFTANSEANIERLNQIIAAAVRPITDQRATDWYRREIVQILVKRAIAQAR